MARTFEQIQAAGNYESDDERYLYLRELQRRGTPIGAEAEQWLAQNSWRETQNSETGYQEPQGQAPPPHFVAALAGASGIGNAPATTFENPQAGSSQVFNYGWELLDREQEQETYIQKLNNDLQREIATINNTARQQLQSTDAALQRELQSGRLASDQYMQQRELAQRESEFARQIALQTRLQTFNEEMGRAELELQRLGELRQERELQAQLAANPNDFVAYEFYKRMLGTPKPWEQAQQVAQGQSNLQGGPGTVAEGQGNLLGEPYAAAPPAYDDETLSTVASSLFNPQGAGGGGGYNPNLTGTGVFGSTIEAPNSLSRAEFGSLSDAELGILNSFLRGGIEIDGRRVSVNPEDYFQQVEKSWIPTFKQGNVSLTSYK